MRNTGVLRPVRPSHDIGICPANVVCRFSPQRLNGIQSNGTRGFLLKQNRMEDFSMGEADLLEYLDKGLEIWKEAFVCFCQQKQPSFAYTD